MVSDGVNGAILAWDDGPHIFIQHILAGGTLDPVWPASGCELPGASLDQALPKIVTDGAGGVVVAWQDGNTATGWDIYVQHVRSDGTLDPAWPARGVAACSAPNDQVNPVIASDGSGGAFITWRDLRDGGSRLMYQVYAQHVLGIGRVDPAWPVDGLQLSSLFSASHPATIVSDGSGGAVAAWVAGGSIYALRVHAQGTVDPGWPTNGRLLAMDASGADAPAAISDNAGGAIVTWHDFRNGNADIFVQHVLGSGSTDPAWPPSGQALCTAPFNQAYPSIATDGAGGAVVAWEDERNDTDKDVYAQHVLANGTVDAGWPTNGRALCIAPGDQNETATISDGSQGAIVTWQDGRSLISPDIYAQHVLPNGIPDPAWLANGQPICTAPGEQSLPFIVPAGLGGAIVAWPDHRNGNFDIYAQYVKEDGSLGGDPRLEVSTPGLPPTVFLAAPSPNPARDATTLGFELPREAEVSLKVYDVNGRLVRDLLGVHFAAGAHRFGWDLRDRAGALVRSGLYLVLLRTDGAIRTARLAIVR
jgi:hypothetical protein